MNSGPPSEGARLESGLQFLQRLVGKSENRENASGIELSALSLLSEESPVTLGPDQVLQVVQASNAVLLRRILAESLSKVGVVLIVTDGHFNRVHFGRYLTGFMAGGKFTETSSTRLSRLHVYRAFDGEHFRMICAQLGALLREHSDVRLVMVDTLPAFYWSEVVDSQTPAKMDSHLKKMLRIVQIAVKEYHLAVVYSRPSHFVSKNCDSTVDRCVENATLERINYNIATRNADDGNSNDEIFVVAVSDFKNTVLKNYCIEEDDIHWF